MHCKSSQQLSQVSSVQILSFAVELSGFQNLIALDPTGLPQRFWHFRLLARVIGLCLLFLMTTLMTTLMTSCTLSRQVDEAALPLTDALPASWTALRDVQEVNIDGDGAAEYLLLFTYDAIGVSAPSSFFARASVPVGPIGAVIYDAQVVTATATTEQVSPNRPTNAMVPYAILPSYRRNAGQGFIADADQREAVQAYPVSYRSLSQIGSTTPDTLIFLGGETYLTLAWWQNRTEGYGVTQIYAPGGFETALYNAFDWTQWQRNPQPIQEIIAVHPLHDRNVLCRRFRYTLADAQNTESRPSRTGTIHFQKSDLGLHFCGGTPDHPFYPEGVVLAYLLEGNDNLLDSRVMSSTVTSAENNIAWLQQLVASGKIMRIDDLASYATLTADAPSSGVATQVPTLPDTIGVCAVIELGSQENAAQNGATNTQQGLYFILRHEPAQIQPPTPDRLFIATVKTIAAPIVGSVINCQEQLGG